MNKQEKDNTMADTEKVEVTQNGWTQVLLDGSTYMFLTHTSPNALKYAFADTEPGNEMFHMWDVDDPIENVTRDIWVASTVGTANVFVSRF